ncbi:MAG: type I-U CRISPR-associated RAMP protein Csb1/Cas7u [Planctomycetota bacterium]
MADLNKYDDWLADDGPAAVIFEQWLKPVGEEDIVFPPTYARPKHMAGDGPIYNIDNVGTDAYPNLLCTIDSVPSQANRMEPALGQVADGKLVPNVTVSAKQKISEEGKATEDVDVSILDAGHRAADALVRFSPKLKKQVNDAFAAIKRSGDVTPMAKLNPTALVFGVWDSRGSGVKIPRLVSSIIRAHEVKPIERSAQFFPALRFDQAGVASEEKLEKASTEGMAEVPASGALGGVKVRGGICRRGSLNLVTLRDLADDDALRRYILGLALVALTHHDGKCLNLRQGCQLVVDPDRGGSRKLVFADGREKAVGITSDDALAFAVAAADAFGVGDDIADTFDADMAKKSLQKAK